VSPAAAPGSFDVGLEPDGGGVALQIEGCDVRLDDAGVDLVWDAALASFVSAQVRLGASAVSCPALDVAVRGATLDMAFEPLEGEAWQGWLDLAVEGLVLRACGDLAETCAAARAAGFGWPWREPTMLEEGRLLVSFDGADLAARMAAFAAETEDSWPPYAAFAAPVFDPLAAAAGVVDARQVADYLGAVSANLTMRGVTIAGEGAEVGLEAGEADLEPGRPARFTYEVSGVTVRAPGVPPAAPSSAAVQIESAGRLDAATLLRGDFPGAVADAGPFAIEAQVEGALGRVEGTGSVGFDRDGGAALLAAEATLVTDDPVGYLTEVFLAPMAGQVSNLAAFQQAIAEVVALTPQGLPPQPGQERAYEIRYHPQSESVTVDGQDLAELVGALNDACARYGC
jgi:hypothetical protein